MSLTQSEIERLIKTNDDKITIIRKSDSKSDVWSRFGKIKVDSVIQQYVLCFECNQLYSFKNNSTTTLSKHKCHSNQNNKIDNFLIKKANGTKNGEIKKQITESLVNFCAKDIRPFSIVDGEGFKEFCQTLIMIGAKNGNLDINDVMPSRVTVSRKVEDKYNLLKSQFKESISKNDSFGITLDMWTNQYNHTSFLALTSHYITEDVSSNQLKINNYIVKNIEMKEKKEATKIRQILKDVLQEMNCFREDNVYVTDNGMNISKSVEVFNHILCSGHNINLEQTFN